MANTKKSPLLTFSQWERVEVSEVLEIFPDTTMAAWAVDIGNYREVLCDCYSCRVFNGSSAVFC